MTTTVTEGTLPPYYVSPREPGVYATSQPGDPRSAVTTYAGVRKDGGTTIVSTGAPLSLPL